MASDDLGSDVDVEFLRDSAREFLSGRAEKSAESESVAELAAMDWTGLLVDETFGGAGWRPVEAAVVSEEIGRAGDRSTWLGTTIAAAALASAADDVRERWLPDLLGGAVAAGVALAGDTVRASWNGYCGLLITLGGNGVHLIDEVPTPFADDDLFDVTRPIRRLSIADVPSVLIGSTERAAELRLVTRLLMSADSVGAMSRTLERLVSYLRERIAFGVPIASFQSVQHRLVELLVVEVKARAIVMKAMRAVAAEDPQAAVLGAAAHAYVAAKATAAVDECMQLSGGIGFTWEYPLHHELRRVFDNANVFGPARAIRSEFAQVSGW